MNNTIEQLLYTSGLTAQGCWEELDWYTREAIMTLVQHTAEHCAQLVQDAVDHREPASTYPSMIRRQFLGSGKIDSSHQQ